MNITDSVIVACHTLEIFHCQFDPCDNSPKAVAAATERFIKQNEPQASAWGRNWIAAGCSAYCFRLYHCRMFNLGIKLQHRRSLDLCWRWLGKSRQDWIISMSVLRTMDLSSCGAGSINMALVILGFSPEGGQQHSSSREQICAWQSLPECLCQSLKRCRTGLHLRSSWSCTITKPHQQHLSPRFIS